MTSTDVAAQRAAGQRTEAYQNSLDDLGAVKQVESSLQDLLVAVRAARHRLEAKTVGQKKDLIDAGQTVPLGPAKVMPGHQKERRTTAEYIRLINGWVEQFTR